MFVPYALAGGMALALLALFCEIGSHFRWSALRKWVGGFTVVAVTMGVVPQIANELSQLAVAAVCSCLVLALSARGYQEVSRKPNETAASQPEATQPLEPMPSVQDPPSSVSSLLLEADVEEPQAVEEQETMEDQEAVDEPSAPEMDAEWLNEQIAAGYQAKAAGELRKALEAFEGAAAACQDEELVEMLKDEVVECALMIKLSREFDMMAS